MSGWLAEALAATGPLVWVVGEAGVGKTSFLGAAAPGVLRVGCREAWQGVAFGALAPLVQDHLAATSEFQAVGDDLAPLLPEAPSGPAGPPLEASARARLLLALARMFEEGGGNGSAIDLVVDDAQWADDGTLALIATLVERGRTRTLVAYREHEVSPGLLGLVRRFDDANVVRLSPLEDDGVIALLGELMGAGSGPPLFGRWLKRVTGGNPMFMLETLRSLFEAGELRLENGRWHSRIDHVTRDYTELRVPTVVHDTVRRRLDRLGSGTERVVQALAVAGGRLSIDTLAAVSGVSVWVAADALEAAQQAGLLRPSALAAEEEADAFVHDLIRQAVYDGVPATRKRLLHARFARAGSEGRPDARVAEHWLAAGEARLAQEAFERAAVELRRRGLHDDGLTLLERAQALVESDTERDRLDGLRVRTLREAGRVDEALAAARTLLAREPASLEARAQAQDVLAMVAVMGRDFEAARAASDAGLAAARASGDADMVRQLASTQAVVAFESGGHEHALALLEPMLEDHEPWRESGPGAYTLSNVAALFDALGRSEEALPLHLDALAIARRCGARREQVDIVTNLLYCCMELGNSDLGLVAAREALAFGSFEGTDGLRLNLARALLDLGRHDEALEHYRLAAETAWDPSYRALAWAQVASLEAAAGGDASAALERALALAGGPLSHVALARIAIVGAHHGSGQQRDALRKVVARVDPAGLPEYLRTEFEREAAARGAS
ncbi:MAG: AAA family ATPase [Trueperaceae bacterium]